ncbi:MAG: UvrB/UvrC motif-containing protein [Lentisphaeria bacterium]
MRCDICGKEEAVLHVKQVINEQAKTLHLCPGCAAGKGLQVNDEDVDFSSLITNIAAELLPSEKGGEEAVEWGAASEALTCPECGLQTSQFKKTGRLGCPACYETFAKLLKPGLAAIHRGMQHRGRQPESDALSGTGEAGNEYLLFELNEQLKRAVAAEAYEEAARLRDRIHQFTASSGGEK